MVCLTALVLNSVRTGWEYGYLVSFGEMVGVGKVSSHGWGVGMNSNINFTMYKNNSKLMMT